MWLAPFTCTSMGPWFALQDGRSCAPISLGTSSAVPGYWVRFTKRRHNFCCFGASESCKMVNITTRDLPPLPDWPVLQSMMSSLKSEIGFSLSTLLLLWELRFDIHCQSVNKQSNIRMNSLSRGTNKFVDQIPKLWEVQQKRMARIFHYLQKRPHTDYNLGRPIVC